MKILHIARNLPLKKLEGNPIIWEIIDNLEKIPGLDQKVLFPAEYVPKFFTFGRFKVFSEFKGTSHKRGYKILFCNFFRIPKAYDFYFADSIINRADVVDYAKGVNLSHAHYILPDGLVALRLKKDLNIPYVVTVRAGELDKLEKIDQKSRYFRKYESVLLHSSKVISPSYYIATRLRSLFKFDLNIVCIPHGLNESQYSYFNEVDGPIKFACCSQLIERKNIDILCRAFNNAVSKSKSDAELTIVGDGPLLSTLSSKFGASINFVGKKDYGFVQKLFSEANVFALVSDSETFGMVYIEALSKGCLVIGKKHSGIDGYIKDSIFVGDEQELESVFSDILNGNIELNKLAKNSYLEAKNIFVWNKVIKEYSNVYIEAVESGN
ncbi:glycosyltransferase family 4 protein [Vibrio comitans]|uniref:N-acetyl-alpha-D-glucosaminyl L-malate synthase n=1 Tax=Vibrio comitans NBRC 102076 TaxID=1219078 RepID=A0A4Y3ISA7_9VIBR|nr:glycosyltransferase family 4 protein [Vibrio comitans]GEA62002.1 N-acetyl-alpha-D-glucosaminyl L-malate synthase [Vibrio comitans NBRC 102076]